MHYAIVIIITIASATMNILYHSDYRYNAIIISLLLYLIIATSTLVRINCNLYDTTEFYKKNIIFFFACVILYVCNIIHNE